MTQSCKYCYRIVGRACQSATEASECKSLEHSDPAPFKWSPVSWSASTIRIFQDQHPVDGGRVALWYVVGEHTKDVFFPIKEVAEHVARTTYPNDPNPYSRVFYRDFYPEADSEHNQVSLDESFYNDVKALLRAVNDVLRHGMEANRRERLIDVAANVDAYFDTDDPVQNGWVGSDGRP